MGTSSSPRYFACEKGHPVREGSTLCTQCGAQVTTRVASAPRSTKPSPSETVWGNATPPAHSPGPSPLGGTDPLAAARRRTLVASVAGGVVALAGGVLFIASAGSSSDEGPDRPGDSGLRPACGGLANAEIELDGVVTNAPPLLCFVVTEETTLTVGATSLSNGDLTLEVETSEGVFWAGADDTVGTNPEVALSFLPGTYLVTIAEYGGLQPGDFDVFVRTETGPVTDPSLPMAWRCGDPSVPRIFVNGPEHSTGVTGPYACLEVAEPAFIKVGLVGDRGGVPDLNLAIHVYDGDQPEFLRSVDDTIGVDPEMNLTLEPGMYLLEVWTLDGSPLGEYSIYADDTRAYFRTGTVSAPFAELTAADCGSPMFPMVSLDGEVALPEGATVACVTIPDVRRVSLAAVSGSAQDLTLEVIGFDEDGTPVQYALVDDDLWATRFDELDPRLDIVLPAGTYALGVAEFWGAAPTGVVVSVEDMDR